MSAKYFELLVGDLEMTEPSTGAKTPPSRSSSGETRLNEHQQTEVPQEKSGFSAGHNHITRTVSHKSVPVTYFAGDGELQRQVTRQETGISTHTQDPNADDFDFEQHLRHILRKADKEGVKRRDLGGQSSFSFLFSTRLPVSRCARTIAEPFLPVSLWSIVTFKDLTVKGTGSGVSYGSSLTGTITSIPGIPKAIKAALHPKVKVILDSFTGTVRQVLEAGPGCSEARRARRSREEATRLLENFLSLISLLTIPIRCH